MFTRVKTADEIENLRKSGRILAEILQGVREIAKPGVSGLDVDAFVASEAEGVNAKCAFKGYNGFPASICISANDEVVHGIPSDRPFETGDVVKFDFGINYGGMITDSAFTMVIGEQPTGDKKRLIEATEAALYRGLEEIEAGDRVGDISAAIEEALKGTGLGIVRDLVGHGVGHQVHEEPDIPNHGRAGRGPVLKKHMSLAIEPITTLGDYNIKMDDDGWTVRTVDGSLAAQFEHTILVLEDGCEILTKL